MASESKGPGTCMYIHHEYWLAAYNFAVCAVLVTQVHSQTHRLECKVISQKRM